MSGRRILHTALCTLLLAAGWLAPRPVHARTSAQGTIAYIRNNAFWLLRLAGGSPQMLANAGQPTETATAVTGKLLLSPDTHWLFYLTLDPNQQTLFGYQLGKASPIQFLSAGTATSVAPVLAYVVSPDSKTLVAAQPTANGTALMHYDLRAADPRQSVRTLITVPGAVNSLFFGGPGNGLYYGLSTGGVDSSALWREGEAHPIVTDMRNDSKVRPFDITPGGRITYIHSFVANVDKPFRLIVLENERAKPRQIAAYANILTDPRWSPDGTAVAVYYQATAKEGTDDLVSADGGHRSVLTRLAPFGLPRDHWYASAPYWRPDGASLVIGISGYYSDHNGSVFRYGDIWLLSSTGQKIRELATEASTFTYTP